MDLSIVVVNWNTEKITEEAIYSIFEHTKGIKFEVIVIDNASSDGSVKMLKKLQKKHSNLKLMLNKDNTGFGKGNNQGFEVSKGEYILMLNTDTIIHDNVLGEMVAWMRKHPKVGVSTCSLRNKDGSMQGTGGYFPTLFRVFNWMLFLDDLPFFDLLVKPFHPMHHNSPFYKGENLFDKAHEQDWVTGAFVMIKKEILDDVGYFDDDYFMYTEEVDLFYRIKKKGWKIMYLPKWSITHLGGASSTTQIPILSEFKGVKIFYKKHMPEWQFPILRFLLKIGAGLRIPLFGIMKGKDGAKTYIKAFRLA